MAKRIPTSAKVVFERAGFIVDRNDNYLLINWQNEPQIALRIEGSAIDNDEIARILGEKGFDADGYKKAD